MKREKHSALVFHTCKILARVTVVTLVAEDIAAFVDAETNLCADGKREQAENNRHGQEGERDWARAELALAHNEHDPVKEEQQ